ncbi:ribosome maturation factor RimP [Rhodovibrionaceae bacterium A322]
MQKRTGWSLASDRQDSKRLARTSEGKAASIEELIAPTVEDLGMEIVRVALMGDRDTTLQIMAERPDGTMSIDDCADLSRAVSTLLEVEDPIAGRYTLEVSSPGLDRPLTRLKDYERFAGYEARVEMEVSQDGQRRFRGRLLGIEEELVLIQGEGDDAPHRLAFQDILRGKLILTDELLASAKA